MTALWLELQGLLSIQLAFACLLIPVLAAYGGWLRLFGPSFMKKDRAAG